MKNQIFDKNRFMTKIILGLILCGWILYGSNNLIVAQPSLTEREIKARVAIIIDDVGFLQHPGEELLQIPARLTWSVLPFGPYSKELALAGHQRGFEVMLHLPMAAIHGKINPGPGLIERNWPHQKMLAQLAADLREVPGATGINNHMGSPGHRDQVLMSTVDAGNQNPSAFLY